MEIKRIDYTLHDIGTDMSVDGIIIKSPFITVSSRKLEELCGYRSKLICRINQQELLLAINPKYSPEDCAESLAEIIEYVDKKEKELNKKITNYNKWSKKFIKNIIGNYDQNKIEIGIEQQCKIKNDTPTRTFRKYNGIIQNTIIYIKPINGFGTLTEDSRIFFQDHISFCDKLRYDESMPRAYIENNKLCIEIPIDTKKSYVESRINKIAEFMMELFSKHDCNKVFEINKTVLEFIKQKNIDDDTISLDLDKKYKITKNQIEYPAILFRSELLNICDQTTINSLKHYSAVMDIRYTYSGISLTIDVDKNIDFESQLEQVYNYLITWCNTHGLNFKEKQLEFINELNDKIQKQYNGFFNLEIDEIISGINGSCGTFIAIRHKKNIIGTRSIMEQLYKTVGFSQYRSDISVFIPYHESKEDIEHDMMKICKLAYNLYEKNKQEYTEYYQMIDNLIQKHQTD
jgi:hypothetical protein